MSFKTELTELVKGMSPKLNSGEYVFVTVKETHIIGREETICEFKEEEGVTVVIKKEKADVLKLEYSYVASWITLMVHSSLEAVGLTAIFSSELSKYNISCNVIAGYHHDHIFVDKKDALKAIEVLKALSKSCE